MLPLYRLDSLRHLNAARAKYGAKTLLNCCRRCYMVMGSGFVVVPDAWEEVLRSTPDDAPITSTQIEACDMQLNGVAAFPQHRKLAAAPAAARGAAAASGGAAAASASIDLTGDSSDDGEDGCSPLR